MASLLSSCNKRHAKLFGFRVCSISVIDLKILVAVFLASYNYEHLNKVFKIL